MSKRLRTDTKKRHTRNTGRRKHFLSSSRSLNYQSSHRFPRSLKTISILLSSLFYLSLVPISYLRLSAKPTSSSLLPRQRPYWLPRRPGYGIRSFFQAEDVEDPGICGRLCPIRHQPRVSTTSREIGGPRRFGRASGPRLPDHLLSGSLEVSVSANPQ